LLKQNLQVYAFTRSDSQKESFLSKLMFNGNLKILSIDLNSQSAIIDAISEIKPTEVYNMAAQSSVGKSFDSPSETFQSIVTLTSVILESAKLLNSKARYFFAGSSEIFGNTLSPATVSSPCSPLSPYAIAKEAAFKLVTLYRETYNLNCVTGILFNHESPYRSANFVTHKIINSAIACSINPSLKVPIGNLQIHRDWGWAAEYVEAIQLITRADPLNDHVICTGRSVMLEYFVKQAFSSLKLNWQDHIISDPNLFRPTDIIMSSGSPIELNNLLGWSSSADVDDVIERLIANYSKF
jgi:GDPmannose 4,6-dehydratase